MYVHQLVARSPAWAARLQEKRVLVVAAAAPRAAQLEALVIATHARATFHVVRHHPEQSSTPPACAAKHAQPGTSRRHGRRARGAAAGPGTRRAPCAGTGSPGRLLQRRGTTPRGVVTVHVQLTSCVPTRPCYSALLCSPPQLALARTPPPGLRAPGRDGRRFRGRALVRCSRGVLARHALGSHASLPFFVQPWRPVKHGLLLKAASTGNVSRRMGESFLRKKQAAQLAA